MSARKKRKRSVLLERAVRHVRAYANSIHRWRPDVSRSRNMAKALTVIVQDATSENPKHREAFAREYLSDLSVQRSGVRWLQTFMHLIMDKKESGGGFWYGGDEIWFKKCIQDLKAWLILLDLEGRLP